MRTIESKMFTQNAQPMRMENALKNHNRLCVDRVLDADWKYIFVLRCELIKINWFASDKIVLLSSSLQFNLDDRDEWLQHYCLLDRPIFILVENKCSYLKPLEIDYGLVSLVVVPR